MIQNTVIQTAETGNEALDNSIEIAGYSYDRVQDIFYSDMYPWQKQIGYCRLYDEGAALLGMIVDSEPIYFEYDGRKWLIELWKGQYDLACGCEIGVYTNGRRIGIPKIASGMFYTSAADSDMLHMACRLSKNGKTMFVREGVHWWLTGFKLGEFADPEELTLEVAITLHNHQMRDAFIQGLLDVGYSLGEITVRNNTVFFKFDTPHSIQPHTRKENTDKIIQWKNKELCELFQSLTGSYLTIPEKIKSLQESSPHLHELILKHGRPRAGLILIPGITILGLAFLGIKVGKAVKRSFS